MPLSEMMQSLNFGDLELVICHPVTDITIWFVSSNKPSVEVPFTFLWNQQC